MDSSRPTEIAARLEKELRAGGNLETAVAEKKYLKSDLEFYGDSMGAIHEIVKAFIRGQVSMHISSGITMREATKYLNADQRDKLMTA